MKFYHLDNEQVTRIITQFLIDRGVGVQLHAPHGNDWLTPSDIQYELTQGVVEVRVRIADTTKEVALGDEIRGLSLRPSVKKS